MPYLVMVFRRRQGPPIIRDKHEVPWSNLAHDASSTQNVTLVNATPAADKNISSEVEIGHQVRFIYAEFQFSAEAATTTTIVHWQFRIVPTGMTFGAPSFYYQDERAYIIKRGMEMVPKSTALVVKRIVGIPIPRIYQRTKANQKINFSYVATSSGTINACGFVIYKEIS